MYRSDRSCGYEGTVEPTLRSAVTEDHKYERYLQRIDRRDILHGFRSIGHCCFDAAVPIHFNRQCI